MNHRKEFGQLVWQLMEQHGLVQQDWVYVYNERLRRILGRCIYREKILEFSLPYVDNNPLEVLKDTVLHEIAHALVGPGNRHNIIWKNKARQIGAVPRSCSIAEIEMPISYYVQCDNHGLVGRWYRKPKYSTYICRHCRSRLNVKKFIG